MACACAPALIVLRDEINDAFLRRDKSSDGCCGDAAHAARKSDHNPVDGYAHALDIDEDIEPGRDLLWLVPILMADVRTKYVIYERRIHYPDGTVKPYSGANAHTHHLHVSIKPQATHIKTPWLGHVVPPQHPPEDEMTPEQLNTIKAAIQESEDRIVSRTVAEVQKATGAQRDTIADQVRRLAVALGLPVRKVPTGDKGV